MKKIVLCTLLGLASVGAMAGEFYVGGSLGQTTVKDLSVNDFDPVAVSVDNNDTSLKGVVGWQFHPNLAAELGYTSLGKFNVDSGFGNSDLKTHAYDLSLVGRYEFAPQWGVTGKLGVARTAIKFEGEKDSKTVPVYGLGLEYKLDKAWAITGNWDRYQELADSGLKVDNFNVGFKYSFQ